MTVTSKQSLAQWRLVAV